MIAEYGWSYYFEPTTIARGEKLGLDPFTFYFLGRGGVLGDVEAPVVQSAFGYFNPAVLAAMWDARAREGRTERRGPRVLRGRPRLRARPALRPRGARRLRRRGDERWSRPHGATSPGSRCSPPPPACPCRPTRPQRRCTRWRCSASSAARRTSWPWWPPGSRTRTAHFIRRPEMFATFGWPEDDRPTVTDADTAALAAAETLTDQLVAPAYAALDDDGAAALLAGLRAMGPLLKSEPIPSV